MVMVVQSKPVVPASKYPSVFRLRHEKKPTAFSAGVPEEISCARLMPSLLPRSQLFIRTRMFAIVAATRAQCLGSSHFAYGIQLSPPILLSILAVLHVSHCYRRRFIDVPNHPVRRCHGKHWRSVTSDGMAATSENCNSRAMQGSRRRHGLEAVRLLSRGSCVEAHDRACRAS